MSITRTGVKLSKNGTWGDSDDLDFYVDEGGLGTWNFQTTGLEAATQYNVKGYIVQDGSTIESDVDNFTTASLPVDYLTFSNPSDSATTLNLSRSGTPDEITIETSINDGTSWSTWDSTGLSAGSFSIPANGSLKIRGNNPHYATATNSYWHFTSTDNVILSGELMTLIDSTGATHTITDSYCFNYLFVNMSTLLIDGLKVSTTNATDYCFNYCFYQCTSVTELPDFSMLETVGDHAFFQAFIGTAITEVDNFNNVTTVATSGCTSIFSGCTNLVSITGFNSVTTANANAFAYLVNGCSSLIRANCFQSLTTIEDSVLLGCFYDCTALTSLPDFSRITSVGTSGMSGCFKGCTALTTGPDLSGITSVGESGMFNCFKNCTALTTPPTLSSLTSIGKMGLYSCFLGCTALTSGPRLKTVTTLKTDGLNQCFYGCTNLTAAYTENYTTLWMGTWHENWLSHTASSGIVYRPTSATIDPTASSYSGCPSGWTVGTY